jgi:hypothetical protein
MEGSEKAVHSAFLTFMRMENNKAVFKVKSGSYNFSIPG